MYEMIHCRRLKAEFSTGLDLVWVLVENIENAVNTQSNAVFCLCYSLIDTICKTIIEQRSEVDDENADLPKRFKTILNLINLYPESYNGDSNIGIKRTLGGMNSFLVGLCELRNNDGVFSHGKPAMYSNLDLLQIQMAANTADLLVTYIYRAHLDYPMPKPEIRYSDKELEDFNNWVDELYEPIELFGQVILSSRILFDLDSSHTAYKEMFAEYQIEQAEQKDNRQYSSDEN